MRVEDFISGNAGRQIFHFTDTRNLASIKKHGLLSLEELTSRGLKPECHGGNDWSHQADRMKGVDKFVHLCPVASHPMEWRARQEGRLKETKFLQISLEVLKTPGAMGCVTVSNRGDAEILSIEKALDAIDFHILYAGYIDNKVNPALGKRHSEARKSEILIPKHVPTEFIMNL